MAWLYVPGLAELNLDSGDALKNMPQSATSNETHTLHQSWLKTCKRKPWMRHLYGMMLPLSTATSGVELWIASLRDSHVSLSASQESAKDLPTSGGSGQTLPESLARLNRQSYSLRMCQDSFPWVSNPFSGIWLRWGTMRSGVVLPRNPAALHMKESDSFSWPTPRATDGSHGGRVTERKGKNGGNLIEAVSMSQFPTPTANRWDGLQSHGVNVISGQLNPTWVEWLMGFAIGWTDLDASETPSCQPKQNLHGGF